MLKRCTLRRYPDRCYDLHLIYLLSSSLLVVTGNARANPHQHQKTLISEFSVTIQTSYDISTRTHLRDTVGLTHTAKVSSRTAGFDCRKSANAETVHDQCCSHLHVAARGIYEQLFPA